MGGCVVARTYIRTYIDTYAHVLPSCSQENQVRADISLSTVSFPLLHTCTYRERCQCGSTYTVHTSYLQTTSLVPAYADATNTLTHTHTQTHPLALTEHLIVEACARRSPSCHATRTGWSFPKKKRPVRVRAARRTDYCLRMGRLCLDIHYVQIIHGHRLSISHAQSVRRAGLGRARQGSAGLSRVGWRRWWDKG